MSASAPMCLARVSLLQTDIWLNYVGLGISTVGIGTLLSSVKCARKRPLLARSFWLPYTGCLFGLQLFADCQAEEVGISAVWSAHAGFIAAALMQDPVLFREKTVRTASTAALASTGGLIIYYAIVEAPLTTVAHITAAVVGMLSYTLWKRLFRGAVLTRKKHRSTLLCPTDERNSARVNTAVSRRFQFDCSIASFLDVLEESHYTIRPCSEQPGLTRMERYTQHP